MNNDQLQTIGQSLVQHGRSSDRVYLMKLNRDDFPGIVPRLRHLAENKGYTKIFAKIPGYARQGFEEDGYRIEASIPKFYRDREDAFFMARYFHPQRLVDPDADRIEQVLDQARLKAAALSSSRAPQECTFRCTTPADSDQMAELYQQVFASYPFAIHDPGYLVETMAGNLSYIGVWKGKQLLALASAEIDREGRNAELTDFATHSEWRGYGLANDLLVRLEQEMRRIGVTTCYTIARATSFGMNICFSKSGYQYSGTLIKNTQISGGLESMNVWYKHLPDGSL